MTTRVPRRAAVVLLGLVVAAAALSTAAAQPPQQVKVTVQFSRSGAQSRDSVQGAGGVIVTERGRVRPRGQVAAESAQTKVRQSTGIFTLVQDGGESTLTVATQVPYAQVQYFREYASGAGYLATGVVFREVGTSLKVRAAVLAGGRIRVRLTPSISWLAADGSGAIEFAEAATELVVASGQPVVLGGATSQTHAVTRQILGLGASDTASETTVTLTALALGAR